MILKASQRGGGQDLAAHLMRLDENDQVELHELRGFASDDLKGAFKEAHAISRGTKCRQYLFSLSLSPPEGERVTVDQFERAIERVEQCLGLQGQPRAIIFHEKEGRRHAHCVWPRTNAETMTAIPLPFFKTKLAGVARELFLENGWKLPRGFENPAERDRTNFTLAEWQQAKRKGIDPRWFKQTVQECWAASDGQKAFATSLESRGFFLARGDRRRFVVLDHDGEVYSLSRMLGLKTNEVRARLGAGADLKSVEAMQKVISERMTPAIRRHIADSRGQFRDRACKLDAYKTEMRQLHRDARSKLTERQGREWESETRERAARLPKGLRGLWHRLTGQYQKVRRANEREAQDARDRQAKERQALIEKQLEQRAVLQTKVKELRRQQAEQLRELRRDIGRYLGFSRGLGAAPETGRHQSSGLGLKLTRS